MIAAAINVEVLPAVRLRAEAREAAWAAARATFPPRKVDTDWPATRRDRDAVLHVLSNRPFVMTHPGSQRGRLRGIRYAIDWLAAQPGNTWQQRWLASGAETAGPGWKRVCIPWLDSQGIDVKQRLDLLSIGFNVMTCADLVRPSLSWLAASSISAWAWPGTSKPVGTPTGSHGCGARARTTFT